MIVKVVKSSELGTKCWSPSRLVNNCMGCERLPVVCDLPEAVENRPAYLTQNITRVAQEHCERMAGLQAKLDAAKALAKEARCQRSL